MKRVHVLWSKLVHVEYIQVQEHVEEVRHNDDDNYDVMMMSWWSFNDTLWHDADDADDDDDDDDDDVFRVFE